MNPDRKDMSGKNNPMFGKKSNNQYSYGCIMSEETKNKISDSLSGIPLKESCKKKISESMIKAHKSGKAWNIGKSRWNNKKSYPEIFFTKVIENEFLDKNYISEFNVGIYSIDFAWVDKKLAIEIDGEQHQRFQDIIDRDKRKDDFLIMNEWKVLRIKWKDICNESKKWINIAYNFIH